MDYELEDDVVPFSVFVEEDRVCSVSRVQLDDLQCRFLPKGIARANRAMLNDSRPTDPSRKWHLSTKLKFARVLTWMGSMAGAGAFVYMRLAWRYDSILCWGAIIGAIIGIYVVRFLRRRAIDDQIPRCISCGYQLTGLPREHRCPECGAKYCIEECLKYQRDPEGYIQQHERDEWKARIDARDEIERRISGDRNMY